MEGHAIRSASICAMCGSRPADRPRLAQPPGRVSRQVRNVHLSAVVFGRSSKRGGRTFPADRQCLDALLQMPRRQTTRRTRNAHCSLTVSLTSSPNQVTDPSRSPAPAPRQSGDIRFITRLETVTLAQRHEAHHPALASSPGGQELQWVRPSGSFQSPRHARQARRHRPCPLRCSSASRSSATPRSALGALVSAASSRPRSSSALAVASPTC
jgi:hypothetical protein